MSKTDVITSHRCLTSCMRVIKLHLPLAQLTGNNCVHNDLSMASLLNRVDTWAVLHRSRGFR